jgi:ABC-type uncharacterized transport system ATPase subunit
MNRPFVEKLRIQNYGCVNDATFSFTPLHALIGPNDSGKSTVLRALQTLAEAPNDFSATSRQLLGRATLKLELSNAAGEWGVSLQSGISPWPPFAPEVVRSALGNADLLRLDPDFLRAPRPLIPEGVRLQFADGRGSGLSALYDALIVRNLPRYMALNAELSRLFPTVQSIQLTNPTDRTKAIGIKLHDDTVVPADLMSEGMLYYLAFAILPYLETSPLLLIEEPENGLHPARIREVMSVLRAISEKTQVILATHSPLVINELQPNEVTVVTRSREGGTKGTLMKDTANFDERAKIYALGELWLSYANGEDEAPLLDGGARP